MWYEIQYGQYERECNGGIGAGFKKDNETLLLRNWVKFNFHGHCSTRRKIESLVLDFELDYVGPPLCETYSESYFVCVFPDLKSPLVCS